MDYSEIIEKINRLRRSFVEKYNLLPNSVYIGHDEMYVLKEYGLVTPVDLNIYTCFGMKVCRVLKDNYISVGLEIE